MKTIIAILVVLVASVAIAQECLVPKPAIPPKTTNIEVRFTNPDGGSRPCFGRAYTPGGQPAQEYQMSNTDCTRLKRLGDWATQQDHGWGDGGLP